MENIVLEIISIIILIIALLILLFGSLLAYFLPVFHKLNNAEKNLSLITFSKSLIENDSEPIYILCDKKLSKNMLSQNVDLNNFRKYLDKYSISALLRIVSYWKSEKIKKLLKSLRTPSFILVIMASASYISLIDEKSKEIPNLATIWTVSGYELFKFLSLSELATFLVIIIRLTVELYILNDLLDAEE